MIQVKSYNDGLIKFYCTECDLEDEKDVEELLADNCVLDVEVMCNQCYGIHILYIVKCTDEAYSRSLLGELMNLKEERRRKNEVG